MKTILILLAMTGVAMAQNMSGMGRIADDNSHAYPVNAHKR